MDRAEKAILRRAAGKMKSNKKISIKKWEVSIMEIQNHKGRKYKVTRRLPELTVAETKIFTTKKKAKKQFDEWLK